MRRDLGPSRRYVDAIRASGLSIYDPVEPNDPRLWIPTPVIEELLNASLIGQSLNGLPLRTRSRVVKNLVCKALGYPVPRSFKKSKPRFPGQLLDTYTQKANNLQIWNEEIAPTRRYALICLSPDSVIRRVKVVTGEVLAKLDTTGTLTQKYQARLLPGELDRELITAEDTDVVSRLASPLTRVDPACSVIEWPQLGQLLPIARMFEILSGLVGLTFVDSGYDQERNRGGALHEVVCHRLGYTDFRDVGQFPDIRHQLLEIKLQTSPTIDLGLVSPDSRDGTGLPKILGCQIRHCDVRYAIFYATTDGLSVRLEKLFMTTGESFFKRFPRCQGRVVNKKLQIPLPSDFFAV